MFIIIARRRRTDEKVVPAAQLKNLHLCRFNENGIYVFDVFLSLVLLKVKEVKEVKESFCEYSKNIVVMKNRIEKIKSLSGRPWMESYFFTPASEREISEYEKSNNIIIPKSYKEFLLLTNGARIFGADMCLYGVSGDINHYVNDDFTEGLVPKELLILGYYNDEHICYDHHDDIYVLYSDEKYESIKEECVVFNDFGEVLDFVIDVVDEEDE